MLLLLPAALVQAEAPGFAEAGAESTGRVDYWIVSTRECPQGLGELCVPECFDYFQHGGDGTCAQRSFAEFLVAVSPSGPVCFLVHGNLVSFEEAVAQGWEAVQALCAHRPAGMPATFVLFTWPSEEVVPLLLTVDIEVKACRSDTTGFYLAALVNALPASQKVSLVGFSHGARAVAGALDLLGGGAQCGRRLPCGPALPRPMRASLIAGALDHHWLRPGERHGRAICQVEALQVFSNCTDWALRFYALRCPFSRHALGFVGLTDADLECLGDQAAKVMQVDAAPLVGTMHHWSYYIRATGVASLLAPYVFF
jgi:hypothetical protein